MEAAAAAIVAGLATLAAILVCVEGEYYQSNSGGHYVEHLKRIKNLRASTLKSDGLPPIATSRRSIYPTPYPASRGARSVYRVTAYGADPTGREDSTEAILGAIRDAVEDGTRTRKGTLIEGIADLGGARISLEGGKYLISRPLCLPFTGIGNLVIHGGTLQASDDFPADGYLIDLSAPPSSSPHEYNFEFITLRDLLLDSNYRAGGVAVSNSLRTSIDNCYITRFATTGIRVSGGHETFIRNSFLGQHITSGGDPGERSFSGTAIDLAGNDNAVTDVVIFSAAVGIMVSGEANTLSGVHCYNKATAFGGTGIYLKLPGLTQTRIVNCYLDYTGIVAEDPVQLLISGSFFLGDAFVLFRSVRGVLNGVNVVDNMFAGSGKGVDIVQLDEGNGPFRKVGQVAVERNVVKGMRARSTVGRRSAQGVGKSWTVDFRPVLLFPDRIRHVQYTLTAARAGSFPSHVLRNVSGNRVVVESNVAVPATVFVTVDQGLGEQNG